MTNSARNNSKGITLVELLVAITISVIVITMASSIYIAAKKSYQKAKIKSQIDVKELTTKKVFYDLITSAGLSCKYGFKNQKYINRTGDNSFNFMYDGFGVRVGDISRVSNILQNSLGYTDGAQYQPNTNYIMIKSEGSYTSLASRVINLSLILNQPQQWQAGDYLTLCNNNSIDIVKVAAINHTDNKVTLAKAPSNEYDKADYVGKYVIQILYIAFKPDPENPAKFDYGLYLFTKDSSNNGVSYPIVDGVYDLKISYSILNTKNITWKDIHKDIDLNQIKAKAIKISFKIKNKTFEKVILI